MIELRWREIRSPDGIRDDGAVTAVHIERVLQYRQRNEDLMGFIVQPYSEWQDVPLGIEDTI